MPILKKVKRVWSVEVPTTPTVLMTVRYRSMFDLQQQQEQQAVALEQTKFNAWQTQQHALTQCR